LAPRIVEHAVLNPADRERADKPPVFKPDRHIVAQDLVERQIIAIFPVSERRKENPGQQRRIEQQHEKYQDQHAREQRGRHLEIRFREKIEKTQHKFHFSFPSGSRHKRIRNFFSEQRKARHENLRQKRFLLRPRGDQRMRPDKREHEVQRINRDPVVRQNHNRYERGYIDKKQNDKVQDGQIIRHEKYPGRVRQSL